MTQPLPSKLGRYQIEAEIGRGMMGIVYRAVDPELHRTVALKTVHLVFAFSSQDRELFERRFLTEARVAAGLNHPGIVVVHDVGRDAPSDTLFIALEYLEGQTLADVTSAGTPLDWREAVRITARVAEALQHAHEKGIVHRDIKPANIMILPSGEPKIMDFGIAKVPAAQLTAAGEFFGTPSYMSPEQAGAGPVDGRSDIFSLGSVLYLLITGRRAFDAKGVAAILARVSNQDPAAPSRIVAGLPAAIDYLVRRALAKNPGDRYPDARAFAEDLNDALEDRPPRHRAGWAEPAAAEGTLSAELIPVEAETADLRAASPTARPLSTVRAGLRRGHWLVGGLAAATLVGLLAYSRNMAPAARSEDARADAASQAAQGVTAALWPKPLAILGASARLELRVEHPLRDGALSVYVDDELAVERDLGAQVTKKILFYKARKETLSETLELRPGERTIRIQIKSGESSYSQRIRGVFRSGETRRLQASLGGLIGKNLELVWGTRQE